MVMLYLVTEIDLCAVLCARVKGLWRGLRDVTRHASRALRAWASTARQGDRQRADGRRGCFPGG